MRILLAPDKFKGSLGSVEICQILEAEFTRFPSVEVISCPVSDGGDGFAETLRVAMGGHWVTLQAVNALGETIDAAYARAGNVAILEMAKASGLALIGSHERDPWKASSLGTGQMLRHAINAGVSKILIGIGGSATNDGGVGMALALGWRFLDAGGSEVADLPARLLEVRSVQPPDRSGWPEIEAACDVENPLLGQQGCTRVYGPQKGVHPDDFEKHEARLSHLVNLLKEHILENPEQNPGSGAAGGLGYGLMVFANAKLKPGFELVAGALDLERKIRGCDVVITAEGRLDASSLMGKAPVSLARLAAGLNRRTVAFCGQADELAMPQLKEHFAEIIPISPRAMSPDESMAKAASLLSNVAANWAAGAIVGGS